MLRSRVLMARRVAVGRVGIVEMRAGANETENVIHRESVVDAAALGAAEFNAVLAFLGDDQFPPETGAFPRHPPLLDLTRTFPNLR